MTKKDIEKLRSRFEIGDVVVIPKEYLVYENFDGREDKLAVVTAIYRNVFNVRFDEGFERSIQIKDAKHINKLVSVIA